MKSMKVIKVSGTQYKVKSGNKVLAIIFERNGKWNAREESLCVKADRSSFEECLNDYLTYLQVSIEEFKSKVIIL